MWLYGPAGAGKSSLAQSIAAGCEQGGVLLASFFFSRSDSTRNNIHRFIATLAYSVIQVVQESRSMIEQAVDSDPHIFSRSLDVQISHLVIRPLAQTLASNGSRRRFPHVLVVDGLDECQDEIAQRTVVRLFSSIFNSWDLGWKVLITSRPEQAIRISFDFVQYLSTRLSLGSPGDTFPLPNIPSLDMGDRLGVRVELVTPIISECLTALRFQPLRHIMNDLPRPLFHRLKLGSQ
jgi:archaellum biogenesis ATPase FlaH